MRVQHFILMCLSLSLAGCMVISPGLNNASNWTIELMSSEPLPSGPCRIYDDFGRLMLEGLLTSGEMDGTWTSFSSQGARLHLVTWSFHNGLRNGPVQMWYGPLASPEANGRLNVEGTFCDGKYDGIVKSYYPSGAKRSVRVFKHGTLESVQYWASSGVDFSPANAVTEANRETKADLVYLAVLEDEVARALTQAHRKIQQ